MEYVDGPSLKDLVKGGMGRKDAIDFTRQILNAARFAHRKGIVHRDLKPQNVLIDDEGRARVADFGIARGGENSDITATGSVMGTAQYLSPEQAQGKPTTPRSDIYSIGVILYEALTGRVPFEGDSAVAVALKQVSEAPRRPSAINPDIPPALDAVVMRALAKDPEARFKDADAFLKALDAAERAPDTPRAQDTAAYAAVSPEGETDIPGDEEEEYEEHDEDRRRRRWRWIVLAPGWSRRRGLRAGRPYAHAAAPARDPVARPRRDRAERRPTRPGPRHQGLRRRPSMPSPAAAPREPGRRAGPDPDRPRRRQGRGGLDRDPQRELGPGDRRGPDGREPRRGGRDKTPGKRRVQGERTAAVLEVGSTAGW